MDKINSIDPDAIVIFQSDHGWNRLDLKLTKKERYQFNNQYLFV